MQAELDQFLRHLSDMDIEDFIRSIQQVALVIGVEEAKSVRLTLGGTPAVPRC